MILLIVTIISSKYYSSYYFFGGVAGWLSPGFFPRLGALQCSAPEPRSVLPEAPGVVPRLERLAGRRGVRRRERRGGGGRQGGGSGAARCSGLGGNGALEFRKAGVSAPKKAFQWETGRVLAFSTKIKRNHHVQGNVQVYNVRIPVEEDILISESVPVPISQDTH